MIIDFGPFPFLLQPYRGGLIIDFGIAVQGTGGSTPVVVLRRNHPFFATPGQMMHR